MQKHNANFSDVEDSEIYINWYEGALPHTTIHGGYKCWLCHGEQQDKVRKLLNELESY